MRKSCNDLKIGISGGACVLLAFSLLVLPVRWILAALVAAVFHEVCHAVAVFLCGGKLQSVTVGRVGAVMTASPMTNPRKFISTMAGPVGSALLVFVMPWLPRVAFCSAVYCMYNLLPIYPLDGGRALRCLTGRLSPSVQKKVCGWTENVCLGLLFVGAIYLTVWLDLGITPLILATALLLRTKSVNSPCKEGDLGLQ